MEAPLKCWKYLIEEFRRLDIKGEIYGRVRKIEEWYRGADILLSPHRITTRSIGEALSCGTPVIAAKGNEHATWTADISNPYSVAETIKKAVHELKNEPGKVKERVDKARAEFSLDNYSIQMNKVYQEVI